MGVASTQTSILGASNGHLAAVGWWQINRQMEVGNFTPQHYLVLHATLASEIFRALAPDD
jgi:hypothetical protein